MLKKDFAIHIELVPKHHDSVESGDSQMVAALSQYFTTLKSRI